MDKAKGASGKATQVAMQMVRSLMASVIAYIGWIFMFIILVFCLFFILVYILSGPSFLWGQMVKMADEWGTAVKEAFVKVFNEDDYASITQEHYLNMINYIDAMGYDLVGFGFVESKDDIKTDKKTKEITEAESEYIMSYLAAENRTYMLSKVSLKSIWRFIKGNYPIWDYGKDIVSGITGNAGIGNTGGEESKDGRVGMINLSTDIDSVDKIQPNGTNKFIEWDKSGDGTENNLGSGGLNGTNGRAQGGIVDIVSEVDRATRKLTLTIKEEYIINSGTTTQKKTEEKKCVYNLEGWAGRYGKPFEFLLALHLGTMAPDFAKAVAVRKEFDTRVNMRIHKYVEVAELTYKGYKLDELKKLLDDREKVVWEYYQSLNNLYKKNVYTRKDAKERAEKEIGVTEKEIEEAKQYQQQHTKEEYTPYIVSVENHWYKDLTFKNLERASVDDAYVETYDSASTSKYKKFTVTTYKSGKLYQVKEPMATNKNQRGDANKGVASDAFEKLLTMDWEVVDGIKGFKTSNGQRITEQITIGDNMQNALTMLQMAAKKSDDAKFILRDLKEWLVAKGVKLTDSYILADKVLTDEEAEGTTDKTNNSNSNSTNNKTSGSTTADSTRLKNLLGDKTAGIVYNGNDAIVKTSETQSGTGVRACVTGTITQITDDAVQIKVSSPSNLKDKIIIMSNLKTDSAIKNGATVSPTTAIGEVKPESDILIRMQDANRNSISVKDNLAVL